jgi:hypothetical protein
MQISLIPLWVKILVVVLVIGSYTGGVYMKGRWDMEAKYNKEKLASIEDAAKRERELRGQLATTSEQLQAALRDVRVEVVYVDRVTRREIEKPIYSQCIVPQSGGQLMHDNAVRLNELRKPQ